MPQQIELSGNRSIQNMYATDGRKLKTTVKEGEELMDGTKYYNANFVFDKQKEMEYILFDEGRIVNYGGNLEYEYHLKDHLGSVRVAFVPTTSGTEIVQENAYYPFGGTIGDFSYNASENRYKHTGMEAIDDFGLNMLDNNARWRDVSAVPRFYGIDPLAEMYYSISPYAYCGNNPMKFIDPTGMKWENPYEAERLKRSIEDKIGYLRSDIERYENDKKKTDDEKKLATIDAKITEANDKISNLRQSIIDIEFLDADRHTYAFGHSYGGSHYVYYSGFGSSLRIIIERSSDGTAIHEITHIRQSLMAGELRFARSGKLVNAGYFASEKEDKRAEAISNNEVEAYQKQYSYDRSFPGTANNLKGIDVHSVGNIWNSTTGKYQYPSIRNYSKKVQQQQLNSK